MMLQEILFFLLLSTLSFLLILLLLGRNKLKHAYIAAYMHIDRCMWTDLYDTVGCGWLLVLIYYEKKVLLADWWLMADADLV